MDSGSFAEHLAGLDETALVRLLRLRSDVRVEPVPRGFVQLAERLGGSDSLVSALRVVNRDAVVIGQAVAALGPEATVPGVAHLLAVSEQAVDDAMADLCGRGLAWIDSGVARLPERLAAHWSAEVGGGRPVATVARSVPVEDLRTAARALGVNVAGLRKPELIARLAEVFSDARAMAAVVATLPKPVRGQLDQLRHGSGIDYSGYGVSRTSADPNRLLAAAGLVLRVNGRRWELPKEVALATWLAERELLLTGAPDLPRAEVAPTEVLATAQAAVQDALRAVTSLLDEARSTPITALKKGGVGPRERSRLAARLSLSADVLLLGIDLASAAGLLGLVDGGYAPTGAYPEWRASEPGRQWAALVTAWFGLEHAPTSREIQGDKELPPPLPLASGAGTIRGALLRAARGGLSVEAAGKHIEWFCPLHGYDAAQCGEKVAAAVREGQLLGVLAADVLTECGEQLLTVADGDPADAVAELARRAFSMLPEMPCTVVLQSDLTAVVSGHPSMRASRLLGAAAACEARGTASVWRFTPEASGTPWTAGGRLRAWWPS
jgi:hypothetical protein